MNGDLRLQARGVSVAFKTRTGMVDVVRKVDLDIRSEETVALVGESGSGKSVTSLALMRLLPAPPRAVIAGSAHLRGTDGGIIDLLRLSERAVRRLRGDRIAMVFQEPLTSLNPVHRVGFQIVEAIQCHRSVDTATARRRALDLMEMVGIPEPESRLNAYPHQLSGGMRQRVMIAIALALEPDVLIADEPTTALDVTVQAQILDLLRELQARTGTAILFITHNLGVVAEIADRVEVMYAGRIVESGPTGDVLVAPAMPYTRGLLNSVPRIETAGHGQQDLATIEGFVPDPARLPPGCAFHPRCLHAQPGLCDAAVPEPQEIDATRRVRCARWQDLSAMGGAP